MKKVYLSGKINGLGEAEYKANFAQAAIGALQFFPGEDVTIVNPAALPSIHNTWADYLIRDLMLLKDCDAIVMLPDWIDSKGAFVEHAFAEGMGIDIHYLPQPAEMVLTEEQRTALAARIKETASNFASDFFGSVLWTPDKSKLTDGMLRYDNPPKK